MESEIFMNKTVIFLILVFGILLSTAGNLTGENITDKAINSNNENHKVLSLNGNWEFYWHHLLKPNDFVGQHHNRSYIQVPGPWGEQKINDHPLSNFGYGTYQYTFTIPKEDIRARKALSLYYVGSAYRIWINGKEYSGLGVVSTKRAKEIPNLQRQLIFFEPKSERIEIVIQVSNFSFREGGIVSEVLYGDSNVLIQSVLKDLILTILIVGGSLIFGIYNLIIYYLRKSDQALLYIGLLAVAFSIRTLLVTENIVFLFFPVLSWEVAIKLEYIIDVLGILLIPLIIQKLFSEETNELLVRLSKVIAGLLLGINILTPSEIFTRLLPFGPLLLVSVIVYIIFDASIKAIAHKREDSTLNLLSVLLLMAAIINDILNYISIFPTFYMVDYAFVIFILLQAIIVSNRYGRILKKNMELTEELENTNNTLEIKIEERTKTLKEKNQELKKIQQTRTRLLANVAHDIGSPIVGIQTYLNIMKDGKIPIDSNQIITQIMDRLSYIQKLNSDLLVLSKLEAQQIPFDFEIVQVDYFFEEFYQSLFLENSDSITIRKGIIDLSRTDTRLTIYIDKRRIRQALQNYVENAIKYCDSPQKTITLHCYSKIVGNQEEIFFEVEDQGNGIKPEILPHIFERFFKHREANTKGSGLGLAIVKEIIEQHHGKVGVRSIADKGSTFYFSLPVSLEEQSHLGDS